MIIDEFGKAGQMVAGLFESLSYRKGGNMALVTSRSMLQKALHGNYAVGAFNINSFESLKSLLRAAGDERSPIIIQVLSPNRDYLGASYLKRFIETAVEETGAEVCLHLDHGMDLAVCKTCIDEGYTSVMFDGSALPFEENIAITKELVAYAHEHGAVVEAELGRLVGVEGAVNVDPKAAAFTDCMQAQEFVARTGVDSLAVSVGTSHGAYKYKGDPYLDFDRLDEIHKLIPQTPLVLHGASSVYPDAVDLCMRYGGKVEGAKGVPDALLKEATKHSVCKINTDTDVKLAMTAEIRKYYAEHPDVIDPAQYLSLAGTAVYEMARRKMRHVFLSSGKAD